jgi:hypothetical protein
VPGVPVPESKLSGDVTIPILECQNGSLVDFHRSVLTVHGLGVVYISLKGKIIKKK